MHVLEPPDLWQRYIDSAWKHAAPVGLTELRRDMRVKVKSSVVLRIGTVRPQRGDAAGPWSTAQDDAFAEAERRGWDAVSQLEAMDREGLDVAVLFPSRGLFVLGLDAPAVMGIDGLEPDFAAAIARAYNDWLRDFCAHAPERMLGAGMVAPHDVAAAAAETRRCVEQLGFKAIFLAPGCVARRREPLCRRRARALPASPRRSPRGQLRLGAVALPSARRALGLGGAPRGAGGAEEAVGVLPLELLPRRRGGRDAGQAVRGVVRRREPRLLDGLPARRLEVPALRRGVHEVAALRGVTAEDTVGQLGAAVRRAGTMRGRGTMHGRGEVHDGGQLLRGTPWMGRVSPDALLRHGAW